MAHPVSADQSVGALVVMALGDSLGFLVSGESAKYCADFARHSLDDDEAPWLEKDGFAFGQYGIDTQLTRELAASMIEARGFEPAPFGNRIAMLFGEGRHVGAGKTTTRAARRLKTMVWAQSGEPAPAAGNGGAMRAVAIGLSFKDLEMRAGAAAMQAKVTHHDKRVQAAAQLVAEAVYIAAAEHELSRQEILERIGEIVETLDPRLASSVRSLERVLLQPPERAASLLCQAGFVEADGFGATTSISGFATPSVLYALQAFLRTPDDPHLVLANALSAGGDTASVGAFAGALVGARFGFSQVGPQLRGWAQQLNDRGEQGFARLAELGRGLVDRRRRS